MSSACKLHLELIYKHNKKSVWGVWVSIKGKHVQQDASIRYCDKTLDYHSELLIMSTGNGVDLRWSNGVRLWWTVTSNEE